MYRSARVNMTDTNRSNDNIKTKLLSKTASATSSKRLITDVAPAKERRSSDKYKVLTDGNAYVGKTAHKHMELSAYVVSQSISKSMITTVIVIRAGMTIDETGSNAKSMSIVKDAGVSLDPTG